MTSRHGDRGIPCFAPLIPDGELYLDLYARKKTDKSVMMPYGENEATAMISVGPATRFSPTCLSARSPSLPA
jgi:hypothetical protein